MTGGDVPVELGEIEHQLAALRQRLDEGRATGIGFPGASDFDYSALAPFLKYELNNIGDPFTDPVFEHHTKPMERQVIEEFADLLHAPPDDRWGYVTSGGTEGTLYGLHLARTLYPRAVVYYSTAAHYSIVKATELLQLPSVAVAADAAGEMNYGALLAGLRRHSRRAAIVCATIGTTMTEAVDDVAAIRRALASAGNPAAFVHADAALAGLPLALACSPPPFGLVPGGADSVTMSGHKFIGSPEPCGVVIVRDSVRRVLHRPVAYTGTPDTTIGGSRSGLAPLILWYALGRWGRDGLRARAETARELAKYATGRLTEIGWPAWRHPHAFTVNFPTPSEAVAKRWQLATSNGWSHIICMPGVTRAKVNDFIADVAATITHPGSPMLDVRAAA